MTTHPDIARQIVRTIYLDRLDDALWRRWARATSEPAPGDRAVFRPASPPGGTWR